MGKLKMEIGIVMLPGCRCRCGHEWLPREKGEKPRDSIGFQSVLRQPGCFEKCGKRVEKLLTQRKPDALGVLLFARTCVHLEVRAAKG